MKVTLRNKPMSKRRLRLYLDFWPAIANPNTGKDTRREFLDLYLFDRAQSPMEREHNKETKILADRIVSKRSLEISKDEYGFLEKKRDQDFIQYFTAMSDKRKVSDGNYGNWQSTLKYLKVFTKDNCRMSDLTLKFCEDFREHLLTTQSFKSKKAKLSQNAALSYFNKFKAALKEAYKDKLITENLNDRVDPIKQEETHREFLTNEEFQRLAITDCDNPLLKTAALLSVFSGLRWGDIKKLTWGEIQFSKAEGYYIRYTQKKTRGTETLPISDQAVKLLGTPGEQNEQIFKRLHYSAHFAILLGRWMLKAGISKKITFHNFRHTFATLQLSHGTDIYTVSKMLGHKDLKTTQVYAKIIDQKKRDAADKIKIDLT